MERTLIVVSLFFQKKKLIAHKDYHYLKIRQIDLILTRKKTALEPQPKVSTSFELYVIQIIRIYIFFCISNRQITEGSIESIKCDCIELTKEERKRNDAIETGHSSVVVFEKSCHTQAMVEA